jgi:hypothetical protein
MKKHIVARLNQAQEQLGVRIPQGLFEFIANLKKSEVKLGEEEWLFWTIEDTPDDNFIVTSTLDFRREWNLQGLVFATNGIGDYLLLLPDGERGEFKDNLFVMVHEAAEIRLFADDLETLIKHGPEDYYWNREYCFKLDEHDNVIAWHDEQSNERVEKDDRDYDNIFDEEDALRSKLDDMIDDQVTEKASKILEGLEKLSESDDEAHKVWAINKLSDLYLRGFGPVPHNLEKALAYNQRGMDLNSHKAYSNRAACYFAGIGVERNLDKALEFAIKANEISKSNSFASALTNKEGGGMYEGLLIVIRKEMKKNKKK